MLDVFNTLHQAISAACHSDLPDITYRTRDWAALDKMSKEEKMEALRDKDKYFVDETRRPELHEISVIMFPQTWSSTALGYGGIGGQAFTDAYTVILSHNFSDEMCVYFGCGRLAYKINLRKLSNEGRENFRKDMAEMSMPGIDIAKGRYK